MGEVQDMPPSDDDEEDEEDDDDEGEEEEGDEDDGYAAEKATQSSKAAPEPVDEETARKQISDRLEAIRLNKALGNDDPSELHEREGEGQSDDEDSDGDSDSSDALSDGPPASDFTAYTREPKPRPERITKRQIGQSAKQTDLRHAIAHKIGKERDLQQRLSGSKNASSGSGGIKAGKAKGHKWKSNPTYLVGKGGGGDGW